MVRIPSPSPSFIPYNNPTFTRIDLALLLILPFAAAALALAFEVPYIGSILLFFGLPSLWLSIRARRLVGRLALFSALLTPPFAIIVNYLGVQDGSWFVPFSLLPRYLGRLPWEDVVLLFLGSYSVLVFYEYALDGGNQHDHQQLMDPRMRYYVTLLVAVLVVFFTIYRFEPTSLQLRFAYFWLGLLLLVGPTGFVLVRYPRLLPKFAVVGAYFCVVVGLFELVGVSSGHWRFPGEHFVGRINYFGFPIPIEEFVFFVLLVSLAVVSLYEFLDDDRA